MFYEDSDSYLLIIDGQQRIKSILLFVGAINKESASRHEKSMCNFTLTGLVKDGPYYNMKRKNARLERYCILIGLIVVHIVH